MQILEWFSCLEFKLFAYFLWPVLNNIRPEALELEQRDYNQHSELSCEDLESRLISIY